MSIESIIWYSKSKNAIPLNRRLRSKNKLTEEQSIHYNNIMSEIYKNKSTKDIQLYRGIQKMTPEKVKKMLEKQHLAFISTTKIKDYTFYTSPYIGCCFLIINVPKGTPMLDISKYSKYKDEEEIILPPGILTLKSEYDQKLKNYKSESYMKVYTCEYRPLIKVKVSKLKECISNILKIDTTKMKVSKMVDIIENTFKS
jgi:hypothetical protein